MSGRRTALAALAAGLALLAGCTSTVSGNLRESYDTQKTGNDETSSVTSLLELSAEGQLGPDFEYRLGERVVHTQLSLEQGGVESDDTQVIHQPSVETVITSGALRWTQGLELQDSRTQSSAVPDLDRQRTWLYEELEWAPEAWPRFRGRIDRRTDEDDFTTNSEEIYTTWQIQDERGPFEWLYALETQTITDENADSEREGIENRVRGTWREDFLDGDVFTTVTVNGKLRRDTTEFGGPDLGVPGVPLSAFGLSVLDTTPGFATLVSTPALTDGDLSTPTAINIGGFASGGQNFWNIGAQFAVTETSDRLLLYTDVAVSSFLVNQYSFSVWTSNDNTIWTLVQGSVPFTYDDVNRRFSLSFTPVTGQYLKLVNDASPPGAPAVLVTELELYDSSGLPSGGSKQERDSYEHNVRSNVSWRVTEAVTLVWDVLAQIAGAENEGTQVRDETRLDNTLSALWAVTDQVDLSLRAENRDIEDDVRPDESTSVLSAVAEYRPLETLDFGAGYTWSEREFAPTGTITSRSTQLRSSARLLEDLEAELSYEHVLQDDSGQQVETERDIVSAGLVAQVTPRLDVTLTWTQDDATLSGPGAPTATNPSSETYELLALWRATDQITGEVRLIWRDTPLGEGVDENYRLDWVPFPGGALDVQLDLLRRVDGLQELSTDQVSLLVQWLINAKARLAFNYGALIPEDDERTDLFSVVLNLSY